MKCNFNTVFSSGQTVQQEFISRREELSMVILDGTFANADKIRILDIFSVPAVIISENLSEEQQEFLFNTNIDDVITYAKNTDILSAKLLNIISRHNLYNDSLKKIKSETGLYSRTNSTDLKSGLLTEDAFKEQTEALLKNTTETYLILQFDIDRFKIFNELFGFKTGDRLLRAIGDKIKNLIKADELACRLQADHFVMCLKERNLEIEQLSSSLSECLSKLYPDFYFLIKMGIYRIEDRKEAVSLMITRSLLALFSVKKEFNLYYAYYQETMTDELKNEQELISDMVRALKHNEFEVYLQPQYDYTSDTLIGAEALVRWHHHKKGMIPPAEFIPIFEHNGFITQLDEYVWEQACIMMRAWTDKGLNPVPVSVNISRHDFCNKNLIEHFDNLMKKYNLRPKDIRLEITESAYMENPVKLVKAVEELREKGFCVEMDDFGSGYSSLNTLKDVPVDILKLDMKFIVNQTEDDKKNSALDSRGGSILSSVVRMANWLKLPVIAEGIESKEQADYLKSIGCFHMQGFYFAHPMPADEYEKLLSNLPAFQDISNDGKSLQNAVNFLDASTQATLLFNSFVGGAAIIEWTGTNVETIRVNDLFFDEIGISRTAYMKEAKNILDKLEDNSRSIFLTNLEEATRTGRPAFCEIQCIPFYKKQNPFWLRVWVRHLAKTITSNIFYISVENITFRMHLLELNTNLSEQLSNIMESAPCGIVTLSYKEKLTITYLNEVFARMFGYNQSEFRVMLHDDPFSIFREDVREEKRKFVHNLIEKKQSFFTVRSSTNCKDGHEKSVQISGTLTERSDGLININIVIVDTENSISAAS